MKLYTVKNEIENPLTETKPDRVFSGDNYIKYGKNNLLPQYFMKLSREVSAHRAVMNSKVLYTSGKDITSEDLKTDELLRELAPGLDAHELMKRWLRDEYSTGYCIFDIATDSRYGFLQVHHVDAPKARIGKDLDTIVLMPDWSKPRKEEAIELPFFPEFVELDDGTFHSVIIKRVYEPEFINGVPEWFSGLRTAIINGLVDVSNQSELETGHAISGMLFIPGVSDPEDAEEIEERIEDIKGAEHHGDILVGYFENMGGGKEQAPELIDFRKKVDGNFIELKKLTNEEIVVIHQWFRSLSGYADNTGFDTQRILQEYEVAMNTSILPKQNEYLRILNKIFAEFGYGEAEFVNEAPFQSYKSDDLKAVWEVRRDAGLDFDADRPEQQILMYQLKSK